MLDRNTRVSNRGERYLNTIQRSLERETGREWTKEDALDATLALSEMYSRDMLENLTEEEIRELCSGDYSTAIRSRVRIGMENSDSDTLPSNVADIIKRPIVDRGGGSGGVIGRFRD